MMTVFNAIITGIGFGMGISIWQTVVSIVKKVRAK